jgi:hypothetical protein
MTYLYAYGRVLIKGQVFRYMYRAEKVTYLEHYIHIFKTGTKNNQNQVIKNELQIWM